MTDKASRGSETRFKKGQSGNPSGRPRKRRPHVSAFDIIFDKVLTVTQNGVERELTIDEALQLKTYQAALKGSRMAVRAVLKMIAVREADLAKRSPPMITPIKQVFEHDTLNAHRAMQILGIAAHQDERREEDRRPQDLRLTTWAAQQALSRPGRRQLSREDIAEVKAATLGSERLKWPRGLSG